MGDLTSHYSRHEFACRCGCGYDTVDVELLRLMVRIRDVVARRVDVHCGCRCREHNRAVGGAPRSFHLVAKACDFSVAGLTVDEMLRAVRPLAWGGLFVYGWGLHVDVGPPRFRDFRGGK